MTVSKTASCFQLGVRFPDGTLQETAAVGGPPLGGSFALDDGSFAVDSSDFNFDDGTF
jgi:hypothetical protein